MPPSAASTAPFRNLWRRFRRNRRGSAAVEFALVAPMFFALLFAIIETAIMFFAGQVLETVTQQSARAVLTGQAQSGSVAACGGATCTQATFKQWVCNETPALFDCVNKIFVDVESYSSFQTVTINSQIDAAGNFINNMQYSPGGPCDIVVVRLFYEWPLFVTGLGYNIANLSDHNRLLSATAAFRNEPYSSSSSCP